LDKLKELLAPDMAAVDTVIRARLHSEVALVNQVGEYIVNSGGKRLRPMLVLLSAQAFGCRDKHQYELAAVVEFIHTRDPCSTTTWWTSRTCAVAAKLPIPCLATRPAFWSAISFIRAPFR